MIAYRLVLIRRHVYELLHDDVAVAQIALRRSLRATVSMGGTQFDLEATEGIRKRVVKFAEHDSTIARGSSLGRYALDLAAMTLYWHSLHGPAGTYCWMNGDGAIVARYSPAAGGGFAIEIEEAALSAGDRELALIVGSYLLTRVWIATGPHRDQSHWAAGRDRFQIL